MPKTRIATLAALGALTLGAATVAAAAPSATPVDPVGHGQDVAPKHIVYAPTRQAAGNKPGGGTGISYHGGPVMTGANKVYVVWYGDFSYSPSTPTILTDLMKSLGGSPYFNINTTYTNGTGQRVQNLLGWGGETTDNYSLGKALSDANVASVVSSALTSGRLPVDTNGIYLVITAKDVSETSGFITKYCGWHSSATMAGATVKYSFVGDPTNGLSSCAAQTATSPNGNVAADAMASVIAHEIEEAVTDPQLNAWYDNRGYENADKCAWTFGTTYTVANGSKANMKLGARDFLIQQNWVNAGTGGCVLRA